MKKSIFYLILFSAFIFSSACALDFETNVLLFDLDSQDDSFRYNAVVEVKNTGNEPIHMGYTSFAVVDDKNQLLAIESSSAVFALPSVVYPGETGYYFAACIELPEHFDPSGGYHLVYDTDSIQAVHPVDIRDYQIDNISRPDGDYTYIIGEVINGSDTGDVDILCICYDENGCILTVGGTLEQMNPNHNTYFQIFNNAAWDIPDINECLFLARKHYYLPSW